MNQSLFSKIGNTPLARIHFGKSNIFAKLEYLNPSGSIKDRVALHMIEEAEKSAELKNGATIVEASSGNQGIAIAMMGAIKNYKVVIVAPDKISKEKLQTLKAYGAKVVLCKPTKFIDDPKSYHQKAIELHKKLKGSFMPNQYFNTENPQAQYESLGPEIWKQTDGRITHFFAAAGTGGTISGVGKYLKEKNPQIKIIAVDSATSYYSTKGKPKAYKMEGIGIDFETPCFDKKVVDEVIGVTDKQGLGMLKKLSHEHGLLVGPSSGAVAYAVEQYLPKLKETDVAVMVMADSGRAYLSKNYY